MAAFLTFSEAFPRNRFNTVQWSLPSMDIAVRIFLLTVAVIVIAFMETVSPLKDSQANPVNHSGGNSLGFSSVRRKLLVPKQTSYPSLSN